MRWIYFWIHHMWYQTKYVLYYTHRACLGAASSGRNFERRPDLYHDLPVFSAKRKSEWFRNGRILKPQGRYKTEVEHKKSISWPLQMFEQRTRVDTPANTKTPKLQQSSELKVGERVWLELSQRQSEANTMHNPCTLAFTCIESACAISFPNTLIAVHSLMSQIYTKSKGSVAISADSFL